MSVPLDHNNQDNYDSYMSTPLSPSDHPIDNIPDASIQHDGTTLPVGGNPQPQSQTAKNPEQARAGLEALQKLKEHMESGSTRTKGKGKK